MRFSFLHTDTLRENLLSIRGGVFLFGKICAGIAVWFAALSGEELFAASRQSAPELLPVNLEESPGEKTASNVESYNLVLQKNIFGSGKASDSTETTPVSSRPLGKLNLRLVGINVNPGRTSFALIEDKAKGNQDVFDLGEMVFGRAKLIEILAESVKVRHGSRTETLILEDVSSSSEARRAPTNTSRSPIDEDQDEFTVSEEDLNDALSNLPRLLSQARAVPYYRNGKSIGMRLFAIRKGSMYEKLGLKNGDIVKSVNDNNLSDPSQALKIFEELKDERSISVTLERGGEERDLDYSIR